MRRASIVVLGLSASGCFTYAPIQPADIAPDMTVRVRLADRPSESRMEGRVFEVDQSEFSILPEVRPGESTEPRSVSRADIAEVEARALNTTRTLLVVGAGLAAGVGVLLAVEGEPGGGPPGDGGVVFDGIPLLRFLLGG